MDAASNFGAPKILCLELDVAVLEGGCAVLKYAGYDPAIFLTSKARMTSF
jgi:hypothetical protein